MNARGNANYKENLKNGNNGLYGWQVKKTTATGDTSNLRGYTVGSRAPPMAVSSGTTIAQDGGRYKGVVPNCTDAPAADDAWELYDLIDDPFETRDLAPAGGDEPQTALADLRAWVLAGNFSCECFQC